MLKFILLIGSLLGFFYGIILLFSFVNSLREINIKEKELLSEIKLDLQTRKIKTYILFFIISLNLISSYLIKCNPLEQINKYLSKFHGFPWEAPLQSLIYLKILGVIITILIISYILSKIYIIFEIPKIKKLEYFSSKLIISLANEIKNIQLLIGFSLCSIILSFLIIYKEILL